MSAIYEVNVRIGNGQVLRAHFNDRWEAFEFSKLASKERGVLEVTSPCHGGITVYDNRADALSTLRLFSKFGKAA